MIIAILLLMLSYFTFLMVLQRGWDSAISKAPGKSETLNSISVIIPVRNEVEKVSSLIKDIIEQDYVKEKYEIIVIDDHSEDNSIDVIKETVSNYPFISFTIETSTGSGKKAALTQGISIAKGDVIVTTDADCRVNSGWLNSINDALSSYSIKMVAGPVAIDADETVFSNMQSIEFASLIGVSTSMMQYGKPVMCNGANLAFRKEAFNEVKGYEGNRHIASGDDEFLMRKIVEIYPQGIVFNSTPESIVRTSSQSTLKSFLHQRIRWAGKWKYNSGILSKMLALFVVLFHLGVIAIPFLFISGEIGFEISLLLIFGKAFLEWQFLGRVTSWLGVKWNWTAFILLQVVYSFYAVGIGVASNFLKAKWKGRLVS